MVHPYLHEGENVMKKAANVVEKIQCTFSMVLFIVFLICIVVQVLTRYVPFIKITWTEEIAVYSFIWAILMGAAVELKRNEHFSFEVLRGSLKGFPKLMLELVIYALILAFGVYLTWCGYNLTNKFWSWTLTSLPGVSQRYTWSSLIVCGATMVFYCINGIFEQIELYRKGE